MNSKQQAQLDREKFLSIYYDMATFYTHNADMIKSPLFLKYYVELNKILKKYRDVRLTLFKDEHIDEFNKYYEKVIFFYHFLHDNELYGNVKYIEKLKILQYYIKQKMPLLVKNFIYFSLYLKYLQTPDNSVLSRNMLLLQVLFDKYVRPSKQIYYVYNFYPNPVLHEKVLEKMKAWRPKPSVTYIEEYKRTLFDLYFHISSVEDRKKYAKIMTLFWNVYSNFVKLDASSQVVQNAELTEESRPVVMLDPPFMTQEKTPQDLLDPAQLAELHKSTELNDDLSFIYQQTRDSVKSESDSVSTQLLKTNLATRRLKKAEEENAEDERKKAENERQRREAEAENERKKAATKIKKKKSTTKKIKNKEEEVQTVTDSGVDFFKNLLDDLILTPTVPKRKKLNQILTKNIPLRDVIKNAVHNKNYITITPQYFFNEFIGDINDMTQINTITIKTSQKTIHIPNIFDTFKNKLYTNKKITIDTVLQIILNLYIKKNNALKFVNTIDVLLCLAIYEQLLDYQMLITKKTINEIYLIKARFYLNALNDMRQSIHDCITVINYNELLNNKEITIYPNHINLFAESSGRSGRTLLDVWSDEDIELINPNPDEDKEEEEVNHIEETEVNRITTVLNDIYTFIASQTDIISILNTVLLCVKRKNCSVDTTLNFGHSCCFGINYR